MKLPKLNAPQTIFLSFACMIFIGAILLNLPIASNNGKSIGFLNALFTATSANCVTGLSIANTKEQWSLFGQIIILILIQFGGLGFITISTGIYIIFRKKISLRNRQVIQASFNQDDIGGMVKLIKQVFRLAFTMEFIGFIFLTIGFMTIDKLPFIQSLYYGMFHSISAYCNAGFDIIGYDSLMPFANNYYMNIVFMIIIICGGLGFTVWWEIKGFFRRGASKSFRRRFLRFTLHTKIVLCSTALLIILGSIMFFILEFNNENTIGNFALHEKILASVFQSVTLRTAGFNTVPQDGLHEISQFFSCLFMLIGGSPAGTAGGMKTVTVSIILIAMISLIRGKNNVQAFGRTLPLDLLQKALTVAAAMLGVVFLATILLHFTEANSSYNHTFLDLLFEASSAVGTVGITTGITPHLSVAGKLIIIVCMFIGRLGPVTTIVALTIKLKGSDKSLKLPKERVIIG